VSVCARVARLITVLVLVGASCLLAAGTGFAGGPTSALLVAPGYERAAAVYYSDPEYQQLETLLAQPAAATGSAADVPAAAPADGLGYITVTWLVHDVSIWRIDRIFLAQDGDHLIVTQLTDGSNATGIGMYPGQLGDDTAVQHRAADPVALQSLLDKLGLTAARSGPAADAQPADVPMRAAAVPNEAVPNEAVPNEAVPNEAVPNEAVPNESVPNDAVTNDAFLPGPGPGPRSRPVVDARRARSGDRGGGRRSRNGHSLPTGRPASATPRTGWCR
jgi:hypothetical protein